jgi:cyclopropane-fatty-acyl-phospholipid synthase
MNSSTGTLAADLPSINRLPWYQRRIISHLMRLRQGNLRVSFGPNRSFLLSGAEPGPDAELTIHRPAALLRRLFWRGDLGFAESYMAGDWESDTPAALLEFFARNLDAYKKTEARNRFVRFASRVQHWLNRNSRSGSRRNIAAHYDLGNDFYGQWLDESMTYSSAVFGAQRMTLQQAQQAKYARMLSMLDARPGQRILEIGCGWGGFAEYAAARGYQVVGLTLSKEQLLYAQQRIALAGLSDRAEFRLCDYRDFDEQVDHIVSIEMFEAVGQAYWKTYFAGLASRLKPGGRAALQIITIDEAEFPQYAANPGGFIQTYIFPGGMLPTKTHVRELGARAGLIEAAETYAFGTDYADTLAQWFDAFAKCTDWLEQRGYDERFRRMWRYYLAFCEAGFRSRQIDVIQCVFERPRA